MALDSSAARRPRSRSQVSTSLIFPGDASDSRLRILKPVRQFLAEPALRNRSVSDIAFGYGFNDAAHFRRTFNGRFAMTPREFCESLRP